MIIIMALGAALLGQPASGQTPEAAADPVQAEGLITSMDAICRTGPSSVMAPGKMSRELRRKIGRGVVLGYYSVVKHFPEQRSEMRDICAGMMMSILEDQKLDPKIVSEVNQLASGDQ